MQFIIQQAFFFCCISPYADVNEYCGRKLRNIASVAARFNSRKGYLKSYM